MIWICLTKMVITLTSTVINGIKMTANEKLYKIEQIMKDLFEIQGKDRTLPIWQVAYQARIAVNAVKHELLIEIGIRKR